MTDDSSMRALLAPDGPIARRLEDYEERPEQAELSEAVAATLENGGHLLAEAGTGVGKSFAYLLPAALHATAHPERGPIIISTRTIALQGQLEHKDVPFLQAVLPQEWTAVTVVGRNNYVCLRRMHLARREVDTLFDDPVAEAEIERVVEWSTQTHDGLRMEFAEPVAEAVWDEVKAEHGNCLHRACQHFEACPYQRSRRRLETAQILIVNHALYMADVALRIAGAKYLPDHQAVIFDEAHHLERVATESLGLRLTLGTVLWHLRRLQPKRARKSLISVHGTARARLLVSELRELADGFFAMLDGRLGSRRSAIALGEEALDDPLSAHISELAEEVTAAAGRVTDVDAKMELQARARGLEALHATVKALVAPTDSSLVRWIEPERKGAVLRSAPVDVSATLGQWVFAPDQTTVMTSATLGPPGDVEYKWFRKQLGVSAATTLRLGSPFDYRSNVTVEVAEAMPDPARQSDEYLREVRERVRQAVLDNGGRALVLCTSWSFVRSLAEELRGALAYEGIDLLVQGEAPLAMLLHRKREEPTSVLLGTDSLWEGIDVRGDALTLVIVTRFPFAQPDHPLTKARHKLIEERGGNPFFDHTLPEAVLKFRQGFGRLIRSSQDKGRVLVLDPRARTKRYGRQFLDALPDGLADSEFD